MRVIGSVQVGGVEYQAIWATLSSITDGDIGAMDSRRALAIRNEAGDMQAIIHRNAKLADVEQALRRLRSLGLKDAHLAELFN